MFTQADFTSLVVCDLQNSGFMQPLVDHDSLCGTAASYPAGKRCVDDDYVPVNFIKAEVYAMIAAWEASSMKYSDESASNVMPDVQSCCQDFGIYEPIRCTPNFAPPKRFYRTFWRSITRKMLRQHLKNSIDCDQ